MTKIIICMILSLFSLLIASGSFLINDISAHHRWLETNRDSISVYFRDKDQVDYLVVPDPFVPFDNENDLPIINVPANYFVTKDYKQIKNTLAAFFINNP